MSAHRIPTRTLLALLAAACSLGAVAPVAHARPSDGGIATGTPAQQHSGRAQGANPATAPSSPPLSTGAGSDAGPGEEVTGGTPQNEADPLVSNGLGSPSCRDTLASELPAGNRRDCETSGFAAAPAPTADYGIDVHIDSSVLNPSSWGSTIAQDLFVTPLWMGLVWAVHALVVMLEWSFTIDLLDSSATAGIGSGLRQMQATFTDPWLPLALAAASVLTLYHGLVRRRVADTLGEALLMGAMMVCGIWVLTNPAGTVGALGAWANQASLGTLAVAARGNPSSPGKALGTSLETVFATAIEVPWCYMEFGDVGWCREPSRLDPRLRAVALKIAAHQVSQLSCEPGSTALAPCAPASNAQKTAVEHSSELLRSAQSNGALFLALPANGPARNSINDEGSLLRALCQSDEATNCHGPTAAQAEFRTTSGTLWRIGGVLLIAAGLLGLLLLLGFVAVRLLSAAVFSLLYLMLAPAMVLAPAFGEGGRSAFRRWAARLLGAVVSKLVFSFLLGVVLAVITILADLRALGWWTQWLLMSSFWWGAYAHRHQALGATEGALGHRPPASERRPAKALAQGISGAIEGNPVIAAARRVKDRQRRPGADVQRRHQLAQAGRRLAQSGGDEQVRRTLAEKYRAAGGRARRAPSINRELSRKRTQLERLGRERAAALAVGDKRRAAKLDSRETRVKGELEREQHALNRSRQLAGEIERPRGRKAREAYPRERMDEQRRFLDAQAALPGAARARGAGLRREYAALAALAGYRDGEYEGLDAAGQRTARLEIDRELALRSELSATAAELAQNSLPSPRGRERRRIEEGFDNALQKRMRGGPHRMPASRGESPQLHEWRREGRGREAGAEHQAANERSSVMDDAREVAARRKRQLGQGRA
ncbi:MAG: hypothetical protein ACRDJX_06370 [Solirubrobacteraceae bacterium]